MTKVVTRPLNGLSSISNSDGIFSIVAMDQRNTLKKMFTAVGVTATDEDMFGAKIAVASALSKAASGILLDPTWGVPAVNENGRTSCKGAGKYAPRTANEGGGA